MSRTKINDGLTNSERYRAKMRSLSLCINCSRPSGGKYRCPSCAEKNIAYCKRWQERKVTGKRIDAGIKPLDDELQKREAEIRNIDGIKSATSTGTKIISGNVITHRMSA